MRLVEETTQGMQSLPAKLVQEKNLKAASSVLAQKILHALAGEPSHPRELARRFNMHEQKIYYHIRNLERAGFIRIAQRKEVHGANANVYEVAAPAFAFALEELHKTAKVPGKRTTKDILSPIIENGEFDGIIIVGSPDPHGVEMKRSRDGYYGIDLALFLGTFLSRVESLRVRLDTEVRSEELTKNLLIIGGPSVNTIAQQINNKLPIRFVKEENWAIKSSFTGKSYYEDACGIIVKMNNPFNPKKQIILAAGKRYAGTRAVTLAFLHHLDEIAKGNAKNKKIIAKVVEGLDRDADGIVDEIRFEE